MAQLLVFLTTTALIWPVITNGANAESLIELNPSAGQYNCPVFSPCGPGMIGYIDGKDENGCDMMACRHDDGSAGNDKPRQEPPNDDDNVEYRYEKQGTEPPVAPRLIEVQ